MVATFREEGSLGITFEFEDMSIKKVEEGSQAAKQQLRAGLTLKSINGSDVKQMADVQEVMAALQKRPA